MNTYCSDSSRRKLLKPSLLDAIRHRHLIIRLVHREIVARYKGSTLGIAWAVLVPILSLSVYTFIFTRVFKGHWVGAESRLGDYSLRMFCGLLIFNFFAEAITRAPRLILDNASYVKKVVFPLDVLAIVCVGSALVNGFIGFFVFLAFYLVSTGFPPLEMIFIPIILAPLALFTVGLVWILSSLGVFLRDIQHVVSVAISLMLFLTPVFYPLSALPDVARKVALFNPVAISIEACRSLIFSGALMNKWELVFASIISLGTFIVGNWWFSNTRRGFADVI